MNNKDVMEVNRGGFQVLDGISRIKLSIYSNLAYLKFYVNYNENTIKQILEFVETTWENNREENLELNFDKHDFFVIERSSDGSAIMSFFGNKFMHFEIALSCINDLRASLVFFSEDESFIHRCNLYVNGGVNVDLSEFSEDGLKRFDRLLEEYLEEFKKREVGCLSEFFLDKMIQVVEKIL